MPIDASIISRLQPPQAPRDPLEAFGKSLALKNLMQQGEIQQRGIEDENAVRDAYRQAGGDSKALRALLQGQGQYKQLQALDKAELENEARRATIGKDRASASHSDAQTQIMKIERVSSMLEVARGKPEMWPSVRRQILLSSDNPTEAAANIPEQYDPQFVEAKIAQGQTIAQRLTDQRAREQQAESKRHNLVGEGHQAGQLAVSRGNLGVAQGNLAQTRIRDAATDARAKATADAGRWTNDLERGLQVNSATGETRPITAGGQPVVRSPKLTEDQGKATGWLVQADNAFKNMQAAVLADPDSPRPGVTTSAIAAIPSLGFGETIANKMRGKERQKFMQGASSLSEALLRAATGAGVNKEEAAQKIAELTPKIGDDDTLIKQKMDAIPLYIESLKVRAGPGAAQLPGIIERGAPKPKVHDVPQGDAAPPTRADIDAELRRRGIIK